VRIGPNCTEGYAVGGGADEELKGKGTLRGAVPVDSPSCGFIQSIMGLQGELMVQD